MRTFIRVGLLLSTLLAAGCECGLAACLEFATLKISRAEGDQRQWRIRLELDGQTVECMEPDELGSFKHRSCAANVELVLEPRRDCPAGSEGDAGACAGRPAFDQVIRIDGNPKRFRVTLLDEAGNPITERTFQPDYEKNYPNGRFCGGACNNWSGSWQVR